MHRLRERLAQEFAAILNEGEVAMRDGEPLVIDGKLVMKRPSPAMFNVMRQFLKDNGIDRDPLEAEANRPGVIESLPFHEDPLEIEGLPKHLEAALEHHDADF